MHKPKAEALFEIGSTVSPLTTPTAIERIQPTEVSLIQQAIHAGAPIETIRELLALKREVEAEEAKKAFNHAFTEFRSEAVRVVKNITYKDGPLKGKKHADLFAVVDAVTGPLSRHGLSMSWKLTKDEKDWLEVTCVLEGHGHSRTVSMGSGPDTGPARNAIQARKSATTYLERYTAMAILGLAAEDEDDDGAATSEWEPLRGCLEAIKSAPDYSALKIVYDASFAKAKADKREDAMRAIVAAKDARKTELGERQ